MHTPKSGTPGNSAAALMEGQKKEENVFLDIAGMDLASLPGVEETGAGQSDLSHDNHLPLEFKETKLTQPPSY